VIERFLLFSGTWDAAWLCHVTTEHWSERVGGRVTSPIILISQYILDVTSMQEYSEYGQPVFLVIMSDSLDIRELESSPARAPEYETGTGETCLAVDSRACRETSFFCPPSGLHRRGLTRGTDPPR
jgi:hypothetical protein